MINENATVEVSKSVIRSLITSFWIRVFTTPRRKKISSRRNPDGTTQAFDFDAFSCIFMQYELHSMHFKCISHAKNTTVWIFLNHGPWRRFEPCHVLVSWPCSWRYFTLIFIFYIFMKISDSLYSIIYVYYVVWVIQAVLEIFFRIRVLNEHQTGGCMTMRYPPPAPGRHHHTLYNNRYWYVESKGSSLHYHHVRYFTEPAIVIDLIKKPKICNLEV